ncbi:ABC-type multidrug transport system, ATPase component [Halanaeroarchaeum sp. HSR-CO]|uniref:heme ABC exporter ATP-binding protein CcmA n=1 Tax=Halanaeroarchaeum sp. HSR-CO TaxID=2866382 RepID=UPI00217E7261|nr:heme ABC exporter ATP-binding protein CcmA [Halanaeroarchaeum sp. HSR-CO]UWG49095.1 ABC-type multidrug transport system, ATPase component [Halanaeroarchaeum sp. HSR-CO]
MKLVADEVSKRFGPFTAVDGVSLSVRTGESVAILGPNGSGKTTLLRMLAGLATPSSGTVAVDGVDQYSRSGRADGSIGYLSHESMLYDDLTARENLAFHARLLGVDAERVGAVLETVDLADRADGFPREFSHGMQKRLSFARALLADPAVLLLDEPFTGLDQHSRATLRSMMADRTVVLVSHEQDLSARLCERYLVLDEGRIVARIEGPVDGPETLRNRYREVVA